MYGKHFESMYEGSMYGAGVAVFAVWGYVISHTKDSVVELNPKKLADTLGGTVDEIRKAIKFLMDKDPESRHKAHEGRRLLREGEFQYRVPSWEEYRKIMNEDERREYNRIKQAEYRAKKAGGLGGGPSMKEKAFEAAEEAGDTEEASRLAAQGLPVVAKSGREITQEEIDGAVEPEAQEQLQRLKNIDSEWGPPEEAKEEGL